jgi:hypothetical protein
MLIGMFFEGPALAQVGCVWRIVIHAATGSDSGRDPDVQSFCLKVRNVLKVADQEPRISGAFCS